MSEETKNGCENELRCSVGVPAHNEAANIGVLLRRLGEQRLERAVITEIIVVASGCGDGTEDIVREAAAADNRIILLTEPSRRGKACAIGTFLKAAREDILVLVGADTLPARDAVEKLIVPFANPTVGMTGARPVPLNGRDGFCGRVMRLFWELHHEAAKRRAKCGEMVAFRRVFRNMPACVVVDEPYIAGMVRRGGLHVVYCPDAIVWNQAPGAVGEILMRRRNIVAGYLELMKRYRIHQPPVSRAAVAVILLKRVFSEPLGVVHVSGAVALELAARILAWWDFRFRRGRLHLWRPAQSTKRLNIEAEGRGED